MAVLSSISAKSQFAYAQPTYAVKQQHQPPMQSPASALSNIPLGMPLAYFAASVPIQPLINIEKIGVARPSYDLSHLPISDTNPYGFSEDLNRIIEVARDKALEVAPNIKKITHEILLSQAKKGGAPLTGSEAASQFNKLMPYYKQWAGEGYLTLYPHPNLYNDNHEIKDFAADTYFTDLKQDNVLALQQATAQAARHVSLGFATMLLASRGLGVGPIEALGTPEQIQKYAIPTVLGDKIMAFALTEANNSGSNPSKLSATATPVYEDDKIVSWTLNGPKQWISNGNIADYMLYIAVVKDSKTSQQNGKQVCFIIECDKARQQNNGKAFSTDSVGGKMGQHDSDTANVYVDNLTIEPEQMLGKIGDGKKIHHEILAGGRVMISAAATEVADKELNRAFAQAKTRMAIDKPIIELPQIKDEKLAKNKALIHAARLMSQAAARAKGATEWNDENKANQRSFKNPIGGSLLFNRAASSAKLFATQVAFKAIDDAIQVFGGNGYTEEYGLTNKLADSRLLRIYEGTDEIQKNIVALTSISAMLLEAYFNGQDEKSKKITYNDYLDTEPNPKFSISCEGDLSKQLYKTEKLLLKKLLSKALAAPSSGITREDIQLPKDINEAIAKVPAVNNAIYRQLINSTNYQHDTTLLAELSMWREVINTTLGYNQLVQSSDNTSSHLRKPTEAKTYLTLVEGTQRIDEILNRADLYPLYPELRVYMNNLQDSFTKAKKDLAVAEIIKESGN